MIRVGDIVYVAKPKACCGDVTTLGWIFRVTAIRTTPSRCVWCKQSIGTVVVADGKSDRVPTVVSRLKKIPPLPKEEQEKIKEELYA